MNNDTIVRPMTPADVDAAYHSASVALHESPAEKERLKNRSQEDVARRKARYGHSLRHDPDGAWVADDGGRIAGTAISLLREGLWILSLFAVGREYRNTGVGRALLDRALGYGDGAGAAVIASSRHPAAMRSYARAGFDLHPTLKAEGGVRRGALPSGLRVREGEKGDLELAAEVDRAVRGAPHGPDLELMLAGDCRLLVSETPAGRGYAAERNGFPAIVAATAPEVAQELLWACLARTPEGEGAECPWITGRQNWAVPVVLDAGLSLSAYGPVCTRGQVGPMTPYLPSGPFL